MPPCESKLVSRSSRKATVAKTVLIGQAQVLRSYAKPSRLSWPGALSAGLGFN